MKKNLLLKTVNEIILFTKRIEREIAWNEKHTFLILSDKPLLDFKRLENYLFENRMNELAKTKLLNACNSFIQLDNHYQKIKPNEVFYDCHFKNTTNGSSLKLNGYSKLLYFFNSKIGLAKIDKEKFNELFQKDYGFQQLEQREILTFCKNTISLITAEAPQQNKNNEPIKAPQHTQYFVGTSFEIWQKMFDEFKITKSSQTDLDFMFNVMKYNELIHENIRKVDFTKWISKTYEITIEKIRHTDLNIQANQKRMSVFNSIIG